MYQLHPGMGSSHRILAKLVLKAARSPVLDVGAADWYPGRLGQLVVGRALPRPPVYRPVFMAERELVCEQILERR